MIAGFAMQGIVSQDEALSLFRRELESLRTGVQQQVISDLRVAFEETIQGALRTRLPVRARPTSPCTPASVRSDGSSSPRKAVDDQLRTAATNSGGYSHVASLGKSGFVDYIRKPDRSAIKMLPSRKSRRDGSQKLSDENKLSSEDVTANAESTGKPTFAPRSQVVGFLPNVPENADDSEVGSDGETQASDGFSVVDAARTSEIRSSSQYPSGHNRGSNGTSVYSSAESRGVHRKAMIRGGPIQRAAAVSGLTCCFKCVSKKEAWSRMATIQNEIHVQLGHSLSDIVDLPRRHGIMHNLVASDSFDYTMGFVLVLNAIAIGVQVDWEAANLTETEPAIFIWIDRIFAMIFMCELLMRLYVFRCRFYLMKGCFWSYFDTVIVSIQLVEVVTQIINAAGDDPGASGTPVDSDFLKLLKMGRLLRVVRMVRLIPELKSMVYLILASMSSFIWTCALLLLLIYMIAVYMTMTATTSLKELVNNPSTNATSTSSDGEPTREELIRKFWGSIGSATLSAIWSITGGADWESVISPLVDETGNQFHNIIFTMFVCFATMVIMNLVTGVFVEGAQRLKKEDKDKDLIKMAHRTFNLVGNDASFDEVTRAEFDQHMLDGHMDAYLAAMDLSKTSACDLFELIDEDNSGLVNVHEFVSGCMRLKGTPRAADVSQILVDVKKLARIMDQQSLQTDSKLKAFDGRVETILYEQSRIADMLDDLANLTESLMMPPRPATPPTMPSFLNEARPQPSLQYFPEREDLDWFVHGPGE